MCCDCPGREAETQQWRLTLSGPAPNGVNLGLRAHTPERQARVRDPNYSAHPLRLSIEIGMAKEAANERGHLILPNTRHNQAVASMPQLRQIKTCIASKERGITLPA